MKTALEIDLKHPERNLQRTGKGLEFKNAEGTIRPLYDMHRQRYVIYWDLKTKSDDAGIILTVFLFIFYSCHAALPLGRRLQVWLPNSIMVGWIDFDDFAVKPICVVIRIIFFGKTMPVANGYQSLCSLCRKMGEETLFENPVFRRRMNDNVKKWIPEFKNDFPWNVNTGCNDALLTALDSLAETSGTRAESCPDCSCGAFGNGYFPVELRRMESGTCLGSNFLSR